MFNSHVDHFRVPNRALRVPSEQTLVIKPRSSRGNGSVYERYNVIQSECRVQKHLQAKWELGYLYRRISLPPPCGCGPASRLCCSGWSRCSCLLLLPRSNPFGLPNRSPFRISYAGEGQVRYRHSNEGLLTRSVRRKVELKFILVKIVLD